MIVSDKPNHKIDFTAVKGEKGDLWFQVTTFHLNDDKTSWTTKVIRFDLETAKIIAEQVSLAQLALS